MALGVAERGEPRKPRLAVLAVRLLPGSPAS